MIIITKNINGYKAGDQMNPKKNAKKWLIDNGYAEEWIFEARPVNDDLAEVAEAEQTEANDDMAVKPKRTRKKK
jgi:hypothetical protein